MRYIALLLTMLFVLSSCQIIGGEDGDSSGGDNVNNAPSLIDWDRSPSHVVFRTEVTGTGEELYERNEVPVCTIYGDNRLVWTVNTGDEVQILFDQLTDVEIENFIANLTISHEIYTYEAGADDQLSFDTVPVVEQITIGVNDVVHVTDSFGGWDLELFQTIVDECQSLGAAPTVFEPTTGWVSAELVEFDTNVALINWDPIGSGLDLAQLAESGERRWIDDNDRLVRVLWNLLHDSAPNVQFSQAEGIFQLALEVPNVNPSAPAAP